MKIPRRLLRRCIGYSGIAKTQKGGLVRFRSALELKCIKMLDKSDNVESFSVEPKGLAFPYSVNAGNRTIKKRYKPDIFVKFKDGTKKIFEVKPRSQSKWRLNLAKWDVAKKICEASGIEFHVIDDKLLGKII